MPPLASKDGSSCPAPASGDSVAGRRPLALPQGEDFWVFGYGSLMWHPGFPHVEVRPALLNGYHRRFCVYSHRYRGSHDKPGLVLGLDRGGSCRGLVYRVPAAEGEAAMAYLYEREMVTGVYIPSWLKVGTEQGPIRAASFVVDRSHGQYTGRLSLEDTATLVIQGEGERGTCGEYLNKTVAHLEGLGLGAGSLGRLLKIVERRCRDT